MGEGSEPNTRTQLGCTLRRGEGSIPKAGVKGTSRKMHGPKRVQEAGVGCPRKGKVCKAQLANLPKPLDHRVIDDGQLRPADGDATVDGISNLVSRLDGDTHGGLRGLAAQ